MLLGSKRAEVVRVCPWVAGAFVAFAACSSSGGSPAATGGSANGGTANGADGGTSSAAGGRGGSAGSTLGGAGVAAMGAAGSGAVEPSTCLGLERDPMVSVYYTPPDTMTNASIVGAFQSGQGLLIALDVGRSIRLVAVAPDGTASELLNESEYQPSWYFDPQEVVAFRRSDGVDVLVTDNADAALIHKQGTTVTITHLDETNYMDLHVLGFAPTAAGMLALYWKGDRATGSDETLTAFDPSSMQKTTRTFHGDSGLVTIPNATGAWLTAERLDVAADCQATGQTLDCGGGTQPVPSSTCTWHLDVWNVADKSFATAAPLVTFDVPATIAPRCDDTTPLGLATYSSTLGTGPGVGSHHAAALDQRTQGLGLALQRPIMPGMPGVQFELLDATGTPTIDGTTAPLFATNSQSWLAVRAGNLFMCGDDDCAWSSPSAATGFRFASPAQYSVSAYGIALRPDGLALVGGINGNTLMQELVSCKH